MSTGYQIHNQHGTYFLTCTVVDWVDLFSRKRYRDILTESLTYCCTSKGLIVHGFVIMTNHLHLIARAERGNLSAILRDFKKFTAVTIDAIQKSRKAGGNGCCTGSAGTAQCAAPTKNTRSGHTRTMRWDFTRMRSCCKKS